MHIAEQQPAFDWQVPPAGEHTHVLPLTRFEQQATATAPNPKSALAPFARHLHLPMASTSTEQQAHGLAGLPVAVPSAKQLHLPPADCPEQQPAGLPLSE